MTETHTIKLAGNWATREVHLNGKPLHPGRSQKVRNHSPTGFNWGYGGSGPAQLALAICLELFDKATAQRIYQTVKFNYITALPQSDFEKTISIDIINTNKK